LNTTSPHPASHDLERLVEVEPYRFHIEPFWSVTAEGLQKSVRSIEDIWISIETLCREQRCGKAALGRLAGVIRLDHRSEILA